MNKDRIKNRICEELVDYLEDEHYTNRDLKENIIDIFEEKPNENDCKKALLDIKELAEKKYIICKVFGQDEEMIFKDYLLDIVNKALGSEQE